MKATGLVFAALCLVYLAGSQVQAQAPDQGRPAFEVASVKLHRPTPGPLRASANVGPAAIHYTNVTLKSSIRSAYGFESYRMVGGPDWLTSERYDIEAKAALASPREQLMRMLQTLLEDRFHLKVHREMRELPTYALVVGKSGLKIHPGKENGETEVGGAVHLINSRGMTMKQLAAFLSQITERSGHPVLDTTGLTGVYDITLDFDPDDAKPSDDHSQPDLFAALQEQLGLKLEPRKTSLEVLVIDHAEKPSEN